MRYESEFCDMSEIDSFFFLRLEKKLALIYFLILHIKLNYEISEVIRFNINKILKIYKNMFITYKLVIF